VSIATTIRDTDLADLMSELGTTGTLTQTTGAAFDPSTGGMTGGSTTNTTVTGILRRPRSRFIDGSVVTDNRTRFTMTASGIAVVPAAGDYLTVDSIKYTIEEVETIGPDGTAIAYTVTMV